MFNGMKLPDWHTVKLARDALTESGRAEPAARSRPRETKKRFGRARGACGVNVNGAG